MYFFIIKSIVGSVLGNSTNAWFKKTKVGVWFYAKVEQCYNWAANRYDLEVLTKEEKLVKKFPHLMGRIEKIEKRLSQIEKE